MFAPLKSFCSSKTGLEHTTKRNFDKLNSERGQISVNLRKSTLYGENRDFIGFELAGNFKSAANVHMRR